MPPARASGLPRASRLAGLGLALLAAATACAPKAPALTPAERAALLATADGRVLDGCYDCLLAARDAYARLAAGPARPGLVVPLFETELLIALREKELAMDWRAALTRAEALAWELPATVDAARYLALVGAVPPDQMGTPEVKDAAFRRARQPFVRLVDGEMAWLASFGAGPLRPAVRDYLSISIDCKHLNRPRETGGPTRLGEMREPPPGAPPILLYRLATCDGLNRAALDRLRERVPAFAEAALFLARLEVANARQTGGRGARALLEEAYARFPQSPAATYLSGNFQQMIGDCTQALRFCDETLALEPLHEQALLGRTVCLAYLKRQDEAIAAATHLINLRAPNLFLGYYWRAWIHHARQELPAARADIDDAKALARTADISRLAGIIEHDQDDLAVAETDLTAARNASGADCVARWYLAMVAMKRSAWPDAARHFEEAMTCYDRAAQVSEGGLRAMEARTDVDPVFRASQIEGFRIAVREDRSQQYASAYNAASHYVRAGLPDQARPLLDMAAKDPALEARIAELRRIIR